MLYEPGEDAFENSQRDLKKNHGNIVLQKPVDKVISSCISVCKKLKKSDGTIPAPEAVLTSKTSVTIGNLWLVQATKQESSVCRV